MNYLIAEYNFSTQINKIIMKCKSKREAEEEILNKIYLFLYGKCENIEFYNPKKETKNKYVVFIDNNNLNKYIIKERKEYEVIIPGIIFNSKELKVEWISLLSYEIIIEFENKRNIEHELENLEYKNLAQQLSRGLQKIQAFRELQHGFKLSELQKKFPADFGKPQEDSISLFQKLIKEAMVKRREILHIQ
ncbi:MAG: hypothetical protein QW303_00040 [Nitrososphaerota archaeon]